MTGFLQSFSAHISRKRPADTFLDFLTNSSSIGIVFLSELSGALMTLGSPTISAPEAVDSYLRKNPESNLANMVNINHQQKKLKTVANDILQNFLDAQVYNCEPARAFLREILAGVVLETTVQSISKPEWVNGWIVYLLEEGEPELMNAIDAGMERAAVNERHNATAHIPVNEDTKQAMGLRTNANANANGINASTRRNSNSQDSVEATMLEVKQLNELIAAEDAKKGETQRPSHENADGSPITTLGASRGGLSQSDSYFEGRDLSETLDADNARLEDSASATSRIDSGSTFTSFDQIVPSRAPTALTSTSTQVSATAPAQLTLHNANVSIFDDSLPGEKGSIRAKPTIDYLLQIEPASSQHPGWMIPRKYVDFETLHEVLRRISVVSGIVSFAEGHSTLPAWKGQTRSALREGLERYICDALTYNRLAESEGMKRFLEKDQGFGRSTSSPSGKGGFGFPSPTAFETMGKGMLDVLSSVPKGAAVGGNTLFGGVTGVLGGVGSVGQRKATSTDRPSSNHTAGSSSSSSLPRLNSGNAVPTSSGVDRRSREGNSTDVSSSPVPVSGTQLNPLKTDVPQLARRPADKDLLPVGHHNPSTLDVPDHSPVWKQEEDLHLPPPPSDIPDDYGSLTESSRVSLSSNDRSTGRSSTSTAPTLSQPGPTPAIPASLKLSGSDPITSTSSLRKSSTEMTEKETQVTVELFFAVINELYTLSSAWNIRRTLLNAARTYLLRPGNPNLEAIRLLLQNSIIDSNISDAAIAAHIEKIRENALPTEEERKAWPQPPSDEEKEQLRRKARKLLLERGMPQAITSIMGAAASSEALGKVFDCLQVEDVTRGLMSALLLQGIRVAMQ